jgi:3',5'-cyclic-AMP phosphodiesterase
MIIAQVTDTHIAGDAPDAEQRASDLERTIADIKALDPAPDVVIHTGDIAHGGRCADYARAASLLGMAGAPVWVAAGNRDNKENLHQAFSRWACRAASSRCLDYAIEDFPVRLIAMDSVSPVSNKGDFGPERARQLTELIDAEHTKPIVVFMHHPPFMVPVGPDPLNFVSAAAMASLQRTLERSGRVVAVFCGHVHRSSWGRIGDITVMVAPCTATTLRKGDFPPPMQGRPVYHLHRLDCAGGVVTEVRIVDGTTGDQLAATAARRTDPAESR